MQAAVLYGPRDVRFEEREIPKITQADGRRHPTFGDMYLRIGPVAVSWYPTDCSAHGNGTRVLRHR